MVLSGQALSRRCTCARPALCTTAISSPKHSICHLTTVSTSNVETAKVAAGRAAVEGSFNPSIHRVVGIGSGSTIVSVVDELKKRADELQDHWFIPTGHQSHNLLKKAGLKIGSVDDHDMLDIAFDGADDVDRQFNVIKGGGACHLREKVVLDMSRHNVIVADWRKDNDVLCAGPWKQVPVEVVPFALSAVLRSISRMSSREPGLKATLRLAKAGPGPVITDNGNLVVDVTGFASGTLNQPSELARKLKLLTGVVEVGLFHGLVDEVYFGQPDGTVIRRRNTLLRGSKRTQP